MKIEEKIREILFSEGLLSQEKLDESVALSKVQNQSIDKVLLENELLSEIQMLKTFSKALDIPFVETVATASVNPEFLKKVPLHFARRHNLIGLERHNNRLQVATSSPLDFHPLDDLAMMLGLEIEPLLAPSAEIANCIDKTYQTTNRDVVSGVVEEIEESDEDLFLSDQQIRQSEDLLDIGNKAPVIKLVRSILYEAFRKRASDIHLQPYEADLRVRFRIDGVLYDHFCLPKNLQEAVVSRVKVMANMDIAEKRAPQDGRTSMRLGAREIDLRISSVPTAYGERIVLRLLDKGLRLLSLEDLGMLDEDLKKIKEVIKMTHGIIFVTGPTGSGKTTTLYAILNRLNSQEKNILTIEDPIEYQLKGISQMQVTDQKGLAFASGLRSILRQDPDIIMVGEVRDLETARISIQAALTGHLVFSTLHTNDSAGALTRMLDIGIEPYLVASSIIAVLAQRLVRLICPACKASYVPEEESLAEINLKKADLKEGYIYKGTGCAECINIGYMGRTGLYEFFPVTEEIRAMIMEQKSAGDIKRKAIQRGLKTLRTDGGKKVLLGKTTIDEVLRVSQIDM